ncbi:MAG: hypothetical protein IT330_12335 [Anaerolineae bacterium]|nr:hypothetical protein [Anaerolineae bacterium]
MAVEAAYCGLLRPGQRRAIAALLAASTLAEAAQRAEVGERTLRRWLKQDDFRRALHQAQDQVLGQATRQSLAAMTDALDTLKGIMANPLVAAPARVTAARSILEHATRLYEATTLAERLAALEERLTIERGWQP